MAKKPSVVLDPAFLNLTHARWVAGVLSKLIAVVGQDSLVGLILRQARSEVTSLVTEKDRKPTVQTVARYLNN